jgi:hypothetical protein
VARRVTPGPPSSGSSGQDILAAVFIVLLMAGTGAGVYKAVAGALNHQTMTLTDRWGRNPVSVSAFSPVWWVLLVTCLGGFCYCAYLLTQLVRKQS